MLEKKVKVDGAVGQKPKDNAVKLIVLLVVLLASAGLTYFFVSNNSHGGAEKKDLVTVTRGNVDLKITATGVIKPVNEVKISPKVTGLLKRLYVVQGQSVKRGQLLALMDDSNLLGQIEAAHSAHELARANHDKAMNGNRPQEIANAQAQVQKFEGNVRFQEKAVVRAEAQVKSSEAQLVRDETNARRFTELAREGAVSDQDGLNANTQAEMTRVLVKQAKQEYGQAQAGLVQAKADYESAKQQLSLAQAGFREEDVRAMKYAKEQAAGNLHYLESQLLDTRIRAPFDGVVSQKYADEGAIVTPTTSAATTSATSSSIISLAGELELVAQVSETDMEHIGLGQPVEIIANAYPEETYHGHVKLIAPEAVVTANVTTFEVHVSIDDDPKHHLMAGMNVNAEFLAGTLNDALLVPTVCIISQHGKTGVLIPGKDGSPTFKPVKTGSTFKTKTVITRGLQEGDQVFLGLSKQQLEQQGYGDSDRGPGMKSDKNRPPIPRGFGGAR